MLGIRNLARFSKQTKPVLNAGKMLGGTKFTSSKNSIVNLSSNNITSQYNLKNVRYFSTEKKVGEEATKNEAKATTEDKAAGEEVDPSLSERLGRIRDSIRATQMYEARIDAEDEKDIMSEPIPLPKEHRRIFWLAFLLFFAGGVAIAAEKDLDSMVDPRVFSDEVKKDLGFLNEFFLTLEYETISVIQSVINYIIKSNTQPSSTYEQLTTYFSNPENHNIVKIANDFVAYTADVYDKILFTWEVHKSVNTQLNQLHFGAEYNPMSARPMLDLITITCCFPDLGPEHDSKLLIRRPDAYLYGRLPGSCFEPVQSIYNYMLERDLMLGREVMSYEEFVNPERKFIYDPSLYENGFPFDKQLLIKPVLSNLPDHKLAKKVQDMRVVKKTFENVSYVNGVAKIY